MHPPLDGAKTGRSGMHIRNISIGGDTYLPPPLTRAIAEGRFSLFEQRIQPIQDGLPPFSELLLRVVAEDGRLACPKEFIESAEHVGVMGIADRVIVKLAILGLMKKLHEGRLGDAIYSMNVSGQAFDSRDFERYVLKLIRQSEVPPKNLCFEI